MVSTLAMTDALAKLVIEDNCGSARREKIKLSTGEEFEKLETTLSLMEQTTKEDREIGKIVYSEEMEAPDMHFNASCTLYLPNRVSR